jgi:hypothetical protein
MALTGEPGNQADAIADKNNLQIERGIGKNR